MTTKLKAMLESTINQWLEETCEDEGCPAGLIAPNLAAHMAAAAAKLETNMP